MAQISKNGFQITTPTIIHQKRRYSIFGDLSQSEKLSQIKPPLKLMYLKRFLTGIVLGIVIVLKFASFFIA